MESGLVSAEAQGYGKPIFHHHGSVIKDLAQQWL